jgi:alcohol dehydrogenase
MQVPDALEFQCPVKTHFGQCALDHMPFELRAMGAAKPLLIGDEAASRENRVAAVLSACRDQQMTLGVVEDISTTEASDAVRQLAAIFRDKDCDAIVAVGQGPFIDLAKWLRLSLTTGAESVTPYLEEHAIPRAAAPLAVVPSAAADGFELSGYLRVEDKVRRSVHLMPQLLFIDPRTAGQPEDVAMAETALGAFVSGLEAVFGRHTNPLKAIYARTAAVLAADALRQLAGHGTRDDRLALTVAHAAALGGCAVGYDPPTTTHILGEAIAATGKTSLAQARGILISYVLEQQAVEDGLTIDGLLALVGGNDRYARTPEHQRGPAALVFLRNLINQLFETTDGRIGRTLQDVGLTRPELKTIAESALTAGAPGNLAAHTALLTHAWEGRPFAQGTC